MNKTQTKHPGKTGNKTFKNKSQSKSALEDTNAKYGKMEKPSGHDNDWSWYAANQQLLIDAASVPFSNALGLPLDIGNTNLYNTAIPGICVMHLLPTIGNSYGAASAINIASRNINSWVRHANSGSRNYESSDIMMTVLSTASIYAAIAALERIYGLARVYSQQNRYYAKALITALSGSTYADSVLSNLADFRYTINRLIVKASTLKLPKGLTFVDRWLWINSHAWRDDTSAKHQTYLMQIEDVLSYKPAKYSTGGSLEYAPTFPTSYNTYSTHAAYIEGLMDALIQDDDCNLIWGDIVKAYGDDGCYKLMSLPSDYAVIPEYNEEVLMQIENSRALTSTMATIGFSGKDAVVQANNILFSAPEVYFDVDCVGSTYGLFDAVVGGFNPTYINIAHDSPTPADVMVATRLTVSPKYSSVSDIRWFVPSGLPGDFATGGSTVMSLNYGTEICFGYTMVTDAFTLYNYNYGTYWDLESGRYNFGDVSKIVDNGSKFKYFPNLFILGFQDPNVNPYTYDNLLANFGAADNYTMLGCDTLRKLHETAVLNEFAIPELGVVKR